LPPFVVLRKHILVIEGFFVFFFWKSNTWIPFWDGMSHAGVWFHKKTLGKHNVLLSGEQQMFHIFVFLRKPPFAPERFWGSFREKPILEFSFGIAWFMRK
jgi:hypothetical protein